MTLFLCNLILLHLISVGGNLETLYDERNGIEIVEHAKLNLFKN